MRIKHHFLLLSWVGYDKHLAAISHAEVRDFNALQYAAQFDLFLAPVKLTGIAWLEDKWHEGFGEFGTLVIRFPAVNEALHAVISTAIAQGLQTFKESLTRTAARLTEFGIFFQPGGELCFKLPQLWSDRLNPLVLGFFYRCQMFAHRWAR